MLTGTVKWFNKTKGYGFIIPSEGGDDVFVHISAIEDSNIGLLKDNDKISFELSNKNGKTSAVNLKRAK